MKDIPVLSVNGDSLAWAWEKSLVELWLHGCRIPTEYDREGDPNSRDATMIITVSEPLSEPMIHKCIPCGVEELEEYTMEILDGIKDHLVKKNHIQTGWYYTYHQRLFEYNYTVYDRPFPVNQIEEMCKRLAKDPYTRRAQAVTWEIPSDILSSHSPCLQSVWCRISEDQGVKYLNMNIRLRSNDAYRAAFMNMFAFVRLQQYIANQISQLINQEIKLGRYCHMADSYHIYGSTFPDFEGRFLKSLENRGFQDRVIRYEDVKEEMDAARPRLMEKAKKMERN